MSNNPTNNTNDQAANQIPQPNFQKIETITTGYFPYIVGKFNQQGVYVLGVMDLNDPASWSGGESTVVYYFMITPEEFGWLESDREKLNELAKKLQTNLPKSRFFSAMARKKMDPEELKANAQAALKEDKLEDDEAYEEWRKTLKINRVVRIPATPINLARHKLAVAQKDFNPRTATDEEKEAEEKLERELGWLLLKAEELYVSFDSSYNSRWPYLEIARGDAHIFTTKEVADAATKYYADSKRFYTEVRKIEKDYVKTFFRACEDLGILRFRVDDGIEPVEVWRRNIIPDREMAYLEKKNQSVRNVALRTMQGANLIAKHGDDMEEKWKKGTTSWFLTWQRNMLQDLANTLLYVPVGLAPAAVAKIGNAPIYTQRSMDKMKEILTRDKKPMSAINHPSYKGRMVTLNPEQGQLPIRLMKNNDTGLVWLLAFTSRTLAESFVSQHQNKDSIVILSFDELVEQVEENAGIAVDINGIGVQLGKKEIEQMMKIRTEPKVIFSPEQPKPAPEAKEEQPQQEEAPSAESAPAESAPEGEDEEDNAVVEVEVEEEVEEPVSEEAPAQDAPAAEAAPAEEPAAEEASVEETKPEEPKKGFWEKLFGK